MQPETSATTAWRWHSPAEPPFRIAGFAWFQQDRVYRRLPIRPHPPVPDAVDALADCTAGGQAQFRTDSPRLALRVRLAAPADMVHMPATGQCGFDCYVGSPGSQRYCATTKYDLRLREYECELFEFPSAEERSITLNFPLYQGVEQVLIGLSPTARVQAPLAYEDERPVVSYGSSITQGGCASRPGMAYTNILSRRLNRPFINLGFSGNGRGEPEVAENIARLPRAAGFVLDYEANAGVADQLERTLPRFIGILRRAHPAVPILVVSKIRYAREHFLPQDLEGRVRRRDFQRDTVDGLRAAGDENVHFLDGGDLLGEHFDECAVDGVHPTDLGFWQMACGLEPVLRQLLEAPSGLSSAGRR